MTGKCNASWRPEFSRPLDVSDLEDGDERHQRLEADADERAALCTRFELVSMAHLGADVSYARRGNSVEIKGRLQAEVSQTCVVTLEPVTTAIEEDFVIRFDPEFVPDELEITELSPDDLLAHEDLQPLNDEAIDLGEAVAECLGGAIEPYPRQEGSALDPRYAVAPNLTVTETNTFAVLKKLKL